MRSSRVWGLPAGNDWQARVVKQHARIMQSHVGMRRVCGIGAFVGGGGVIEPMLVTSCSPLLPPDFSYHHFPSLTQSPY